MGKTPERITAKNVKETAGQAATKQKTKEEAELPYQCEICKKRFKSSQGLAGHMNTHKVETVDLESVVEDKEDKADDPTAWVRQYVKGDRVVNDELIKKLSQEERVTFIIPEDLYDTKLTYLIGLNGQYFEYPIGQYIELPRDIVTQIKNQYKESETAKRRNLISRNKKVQEALQR